MPEGRKIRLRSKDGDAYEIEERAAKLSKFVETTIDCDDDGEEHADDEDMIEVPILKVSSNCLSKVVQFMEHYDEDPLKEIKTPLEGEDLDTIVKQEWYRTFISADLKMVFELTSAANYMEIQPLLDLACLRVSIEMVGKSAEEIRTMLNIPKMTPDEEALARKEHRWIFEE